jgi:Na+-transporting NADH:ubiquinone oxidoreductase subunit B
MKFLHHFFEKQKPLFAKGGKYEKFFYLFEAGETFMFTPPTTTAPRGVQVRDAIDLKRLMMTVVIAMTPCLLFGMWNVGHQHALAYGKDMDFLAKFMFGAWYVVPMVIVSYAAGGLVEVVFALIRKHPINEGFLVTGMLVPLICPPTIPLWQIGLANIFAIVLAKEVFGGTGMNVLNVAMTARAFLYFAYPSQISGDVWTATETGDVIALGTKGLVDGYSGATALSTAASAGMQGVEVLQAFAGSWSPDLFSLWNLFWGAIPGCVGETSTLMALLGALILVATGVGSGRIIVGVFVGAYLMGWIFSLVSTNTFAQMPPHYHLVMGGLAFGAVFMATDPVSAAHTATGKWIYGILIGILTVIIRVANPAYPEGIMLAVLLMNVFAPLVDHYVVEANKKRRERRLVSREAI